MVGVAGIGLTVTFVVPAAEAQPLTVTVTEYVPSSPVVASGYVGFGCAAVKASGPGHAYLVLATVGVKSRIVAPSEYGPLLVVVGVAGVALTMTFVVPAAEVQPFTVTVT